MKRTWQEPLNFHQLERQTHMADIPSQSDRGRGALFKIPAEDRKSDKYPIYRGDLQLPDGSKWKLSGWVRETKNGDKFLSISAEPFEGQRQQPGQKQPDRGGPSFDRDGSIPF